MDLLLNPVLASSLLLVALLPFLRSKRTRWKRVPGPFAFPLVGNNIPTKLPDLQLQLRSWTDRYGDVFSLHNGRMIILSSAKAVHEVLHKTGSQTAEHVDYKTMEFMTESLHIRSQKDGGWKDVRKGLQNMQNAQGMVRVRKAVRNETTMMLRDFLRDPENFDMHIDRMMISFFMTVLYGKGCPQSDCETIRELHAYYDRWFDCVDNSKFRPMDIVPWLQYIPDKWMKWRAEYEEVRDVQKSLFHKFLDECQERIDRGKRLGCHMEDVLDDPNIIGDRSKTTKNMLAHYGTATIEGAYDLTNYVRTLLFMLLAHPECQRKAWEEIDTIVGDQRMPDFDDFSNMPYVRAILQETHRLSPVIVTVLPRKNTSDLYYDGYVIKTGSHIVINMWGLLHDPELFDEPDTFRPERYLKSPYGTKSGVDTTGLRSTIFFGAGNRMCPGIPTAIALTSHIAMCFLWAFEFERRTDSSEKPDKLDLFTFKWGTSTQPDTFDCDIKPRSDARIEIIRRQFAQTFPDES